MNADGSIIYGIGVNNGTQINYDKLTLTGFSSSGNPKYPSSPTVLATEPLTNTWDVNSIAPNGQPYYAPYFVQMVNGLLVTYNPTPHSSGMHLGALIRPPTSVNGRPCRGWPVYRPRQL